MLGLQMVGFWMTQAAAVQQAMGRIYAAAAITPALDYPATSSLPAFRYHPIRRNEEASSRRGAKRDAGKKLIELSRGASLRSVRHVD